jgi:nitrogen fixation NifU-like protein
MMTQAVKGKTLEQAEELFGRFHRLVTGTAAEADPSLGSLRAFAGVARFPARVKCASLAWHALHGALHGEAATTTEE